MDKRFIVEEVVPFDRIKEVIELQIKLHYQSCTSLVLANEFDKAKDYARRAEKLEQLLTQLQTKSFTLAETQEMFRTL
jgi:hypothetical protein